MKKLLLVLVTFLVTGYLAQAQPNPTGSDTLWVKQIGADVKAVKFSPDGQYVYAAAFNRSPLKLSALTGEIVKDFGMFQYASTEHYFALDISKDGKWLVGAEYGNNVYIIDTDSGNIVQTLKTAYLDNQSNKFNTVAISPDNKKVIAVNRYVSNNTMQNSILIWDVETNIIIKNIVKSNAMLVQISPDNKYFAIGYGDDTIDNLEVYDLKTLNLIKSFKAHTNIVTDLAFTPDGSLLASCGWDGYIKIWDMNTMGLKTEINSDNMNNTLVFIDNNTIIADGDINLDSYVKVWDINSKVLKGKIRTSLPEDISVFSPNGLAAIGLDGKILMFNYAKYVGVQTQIDNNISISPNPFNNNLSFNINQPNSNNIKIELFDNDSNSIAVVFNSYITTSPFIFNYNTETLPSGVYYCKITKDNTITTHKLIKVR